MIHIFYHVKDLDGHCSGAIARYYYEVSQKEQVKMHPFDYGYPINEDEFDATDHIVFVDITPSPYSKIWELNEKYSVLVIDHHRTFIDFLGDQSESLPGVRLEGTSACELTWEFFFHQRLPEFVYLLGRYDVWDNSDLEKWKNEILPFQYGFRLKNTDPQSQASFDYMKSLILESLIENSPSSVVADTILDGEIILEYQSKEDAKAVAMYAFEAEFDSKKAIVMNTTRANSKVFESVWDPEKYDIMMVFQLCRGEYYTISLYSPKENIVCGDIAKKYGGGGHAGAAGFQAQSLLFKSGNILVE